MFEKKNEVVEGLVASCDKRQLAEMYLLCTQDENALYQRVKELEDALRKFTDDPSYDEAIRNARKVLDGG